jgi:CRISPR type I-E-associated protein CasA/Cse1
MANFNCLYEPWIPVIDKNGEYREYGIIELLEKSPELMEISVPSPLIEFGLYKLLITFLTDALRYKEIEELSEDFLNGEFPIEKIKEYVNFCGEDSFDLFNENNPFLQTKYDEEYDVGKERSIALLIHQFPSGHNSIHFDHILQDERELSFSECAKALTAVNIFCTAETQGPKDRRPSGINNAPPWYVLLKQENLFKTLMLNIWIPNGLEIDVYDPGPIWRSKREIIPQKKIQETSYLEGLTWMARRITLIPSKDKKVKKMWFQAGLNYTGYDMWTDPFVGYKYIEKAEIIEKTSIKPRNGRSSWRDLNGLLFLKGTNMKKITYKRPKIIDQFYNFCEFMEEKFNKKIYVKINLYGLVTDNAKNLNWYRESFYIDKEDLEPRKAKFISESIELAEKEETMLKVALKILLNQTEKKNEINLKKNFKKFRKGFFESIQESISKMYFENLKNVFFGEFLNLVSETPADNPDWNERPYKIWKKSIVKNLNICFNEAEKLAGSRASSIKRTVEAEKNLNMQIGKLSG